MQQNSQTAISNHFSCHNHVTLLKTYDKICALAQTKLNTLSVIQSLFSQMTFIHKTEPITRSHGSVRVL